MIISLIAAMTLDRVIGRENAMQWHLSSDLAWFKRHTFNKPVIMGRKTFISIGKPLSDRVNIVLSRNPLNELDVVWAATSLQALETAKKAEEVMVIGGAEVYHTFFAQASRLYLTHVDAKIDGDTWFPDYEPNDWRFIFNGSHDADENNTHKHCFEILERR